MLERTKLCVPVGLEPIEPRPDILQALGAKAEDPQPGVLGAALVRDDAGIEQDPQVPAHGRWGDGSRIRQLARPHWAPPEQTYDLPSRRVRESSEDLGHFHCHTG
jgi:hypothetical protein